MYFWIHLWTYEREQTETVTLPQVVFLSICHAQCLVLQDLPSDERGSGQAESLFQHTV